MIVKEAIVKILGECHESRLLRFKVYPIAGDFITMNESIYEVKRRIITNNVTLFVEESYYNETILFH